MAISEGDRHEAYVPRIRPPVLDMESFSAVLRRRAFYRGRDARLLWYLPDVDIVVASQIYRVGSHSPRFAGEHIRRRRS
jgi:hypothetical protein